MAKNVRSFWPGAARPYKDQPEEELDMHLRAQLEEPEYQFCLQLDKSTGKTQKTPRSPHSPQSPKSLQSLKSSTLRVPADESQKNPVTDTPRSVASSDAPIPEEYIIRRSQDPNRRKFLALPGATSPYKTFHSASSSSPKTNDWRRLGISQSAPMLPAVDAAHVRSMYVSKSTSWRPGGDMIRTTASSWGKDLPHYNRQWHPLGSTWRDRDVSPDGSLTRFNVDECNEFIHGCVPDWGKERTMRTVAAIEQKLTWTYYHLKEQHKNLPVEKLQDEAVPAELRRSPNFNFWADLRPPFRVLKVERDPDDDGTHPDGVLYHLSYSCSIDYNTEHKWGQTSSEGTFENTCRGYADVRIPKDFPGNNRKHMCILSWGNPSLLFDARVSEKLHGKKVPAVTVDPKFWSPVSAELHVRPDHPRFKALRETLKRTNDKVAAKKDQKTTRPWQQILMAPQATLNDFVKAEARCELEESPSVTMKKAKKRDYRIHTACAGFIRFEG